MVWNAKKLKRKKPINQDLLIGIEPLTDNQKSFFESYADDKQIVAYGCAGTGKTFIALYNALKDVLNEITPYEQIYIVRSLVATREIGFLPGDHDDKAALYQIPYKNMVKYICSNCQLKLILRCFMVISSSKKLSSSGLPHSFVELSLDNSIIIVDEFQNMNFHELDSIITRVGENSRIVFCGDGRQSDLIKDKERNGISDFMDVLRKMPSFDIIEFDINDIVRSGLVKEVSCCKDGNRNLIWNLTTSI